MLAYVRGSVDNPRRKRAMSDHHTAHAVAFPTPGILAVLGG